MLVPKVCTKYTQADNQFICYIDISVLEQSHENMVRALIYVYKINMCISIYIAAYVL